MFKLYDHQRGAVRKLKSGSILCGGVGSGKSLTSLAYYLWREAPRELYIITTAKKRDKREWESDADKIGAKIKKVDSWQNLHKYTGVEGAFFIFDEQKLGGHGQWVRSFLKIAKSNRWILLSATPGDTWSDYIAVFIANRFYKNRTEFIKRHVIFSPHVTYPKIDRYIDVQHLEDLRSAILVNMAYTHDVLVDTRVWNCGYDESLFKQVKDGRWNPYKNEPIQEISGVYYLMRKVVNSDLSRLERLAEVVRTRGKVIVFYNFDYELELLRDFCRRVRVPFAEWNGHRHEEIPETSEWVYLVNYSSGAEGWNCILTDTIVFYSLSYSYKIMKQSSGRIDRLNTPFDTLRYYVFKSESYIDRVILRALREKKTFNEVDF